MSDLDREVAVALGWQFSKESPDPEKYWCLSGAPDGWAKPPDEDWQCSACYDLPPHYSSNIADSWLVVEKMMSLGYRYVLRGNFEGNGKHWAGFDKQEWADQNPLYQSPLCDSLPEAICFAALKTKEE